MTWSPCRYRSRRGRRAGRSSRTRPTARRCTKRSCTTCGEGPEPTVSQDVAVRQLWCAEHAARTGHTGFLALRVGLLRAVAVDGAPIDAVFPTPA
ncbi:DUF7848 domain-containing protein [Streptomyces sp. NBC_00304]|uniref:DUF7848 domain-containing protein n=1 Tax=Streptomyces sp. NBC_00304 TaxID=2975706 RepID=UPI003FA70BD9